MFLVMAAAGVTPIVYAGLMASKYNVEGYNADNAWDASEEGNEVISYDWNQCDILAQSSKCV